MKKAGNTTEYCVLTTKLFATAVSATCCAADSKEKAHKLARQITTEISDIIHEIIDESYDSSKIIKAKIEAKT